MSTETIKVRFTGSYIVDCCRKIKDFVVEIPTAGIVDGRDIEATIIRHARNNPPLSEHVVNFEGFRSDWHVLPANGEILPAKPWARYVYCDVS